MSVPAIAEPANKLILYSLKQSYYEEKLVYGHQQDGLKELFHKAFSIVKKMILKRRRC
jgi:hypothetical protein